MLMEHRENIIGVERLAIGYNREQALIREINLSVHPGEMVALIGRNGTGKSTLLRSLIGLLPVLAGECRLMGTPIGHYPLRKRAQMVSFVSSQLSQLPAISVTELVSMGRMPYTGWMGKLSSRDASLVVEAIREVKLEAHREHTLDQLSDGERQRAMIARAFVQDTPLMVLDEPTAFLDIPNKYELIRLLGTFRDEGRSIIYSTHDLETAMQYADKLWVIHRDRIIEGAPEDLGIEGLFTKLFDTSGIHYDQLTGRFRYTGLVKGSVRLKGEPGNVLNWTRRTLERLGFRLGEPAGVEIEVMVHNAGPRWRVRREKEQTYFENLYTMAQYLNSPG